VDDLEVSFFIMPAEALRMLRKEIEEALGPEFATSILFRYGFRCGSEIIKMLKMEEYGLSEVLSEVWAEVGLGNIVSIECSDNIVVDISNCAEGSFEGGDGCDFARGYLAGIASAVLKKPMHAYEELCVKRGDNICRHVIKRL